jgi:hypothetical protein
MTAFGLQCLERAIWIEGSKTACQSRERSMQRETVVAVPTDTDGVARGAQVCQFDELRARWPTRRAIKCQSGAPQCAIGRCVAGCDPSDGGTARADVQVRSLKSGFYSLPVSR